MPNIEVSQPTAQYTPGSDYALVQFSWRVAGTSAWHRENYSPTQVQLSARVSAAILAVAPGYWADAEVRADVLDWIASQYGFANVSFLAAGAP